VLVELLLKVDLRVLGLRQSRHGNFELLATNRADPDCGRDRKPFGHSKVAFRHSLPPSSRPFWGFLLACGLIFDHWNVVDSQEFPAAMVADESATVD
jgi:hypothetical protein